MATPMTSEILSSQKSPRRTRQRLLQSPMELPRVPGIVDALPHAVSQLVDAAWALCIQGVYFVL